MSADLISKLSFQELQDRREVVRTRMGEISSSGNDDVQVLPGSMEVHWDHTMKEMVCSEYLSVYMWMHCNKYDVHLQ